MTLESIVGNAVEASQAFINAAGHQLTVDLPAGSIELDADEHRLSQVLSNLLDNAAKYTPNGGQISLTASRLGDELRVSVKDSGIGIPNDMLDNVFEMFTQIDRSQERGYTGLGIGLTLVKSLVEMHGGRVDVVSDGVDEGTTFSITLPILLAASAAPASKAEAQGPSKATPKRRVLVVDDNDDAAELLSVVVEMLGNEVRTAGDGQSALDAAEEFLPDVVLMDLGMPKMDGYEAARRMRQQPWGKSLTLVALTGWGQAEDRRRTREAGFDHHLVKPADANALQALLSDRS